MSILTIHQAVKENSNTSTAFKLLVIVEVQHSAFRLTIQIILFPAGIKHTTPHPPQQRYNYGLY